MTQKQKRFCEEFLVDSNGTQAAIRAGYTKRSASSTGHDNRQKPKIQRYISRLRQARNLRTQVIADRVLVELAKITFAEEVINTGYKLKALNMLAKHMDLYDKQGRENSKNLQEKEPEPKEDKAPIEEEDWAKRIVHFLSPMTKEKIIHALEDIKEQKDAAGSGEATEADLDPGDDGKGPEFNMLKLMNEVVGEERIKREVLARLDSLFVWTSNGQVR